MSQNQLPKSNVITRFAHVWANFSFTKQLVDEQDTAIGRTWGFWFFWNTIITLLICGGIFVMKNNTLNKIDEFVWPNIPEFQMQIVDGKLSTNLPDPSILFQDENSIFVLDSTESSYKKSILETAEAGVFVTESEILIKKERDQYQSIYFKDFEEDVNFSRADLVTFWGENRSHIFNMILLGIGIGLWLFLCIFRLLTALWWALIFWAVGAIAKVPNWNFGRSYLAVLNFYIIPFTFELLFLIGGVMIPFSTLLIFGLVFGLNFYNHKNFEKTQNSIE